MAQKRIFNLIAYLAVLATALSLILMFIFGGSTLLGEIFDWIAFVCMLIVVAVGGFLYAKSRRRMLWMILYVAALVAIIVFKVLQLF